MNDLKKYIRTIPDFPSKGIMFRDITPVFKDPDGMKLAIDTMENNLKDLDFDVIVGAESRGFLLGTPIAYNMHKSFVPVRKKGKLPGETIEESYDLEYGHATLEIHKDAVKPGDRVVIVDDLIATGGTLQAIVKLIERLGGTVVRISCLIDLPDLKGKERLSNYDVVTFVEYEGE